MDPSKDRLVRNLAIAATTLTAALLLTADYGPQPHALTSVSRSWEAAKNWFGTPTEKEKEELQKRLSMKQSDKS